MSEIVFFLKYIMGNIFLRGLLTPLFYFMKYEKMNRQKTIFTFFSIKIRVWIIISEELYKFLCESFLVKESWIQNSAKKNINKETDCVVKKWTVLLIFQDNGE